ncbi:unnamed protein product [Rotaria sp. Silwood2]|nr:unnamed protein product [Rotaria sp. Silwood2]CAF4602693.1 unnamed protein product [Rotaria sp. Silwood2]
MLTDEGRNGNCDQNLLSNACIHFMNSGQQYAVLSQQNQIQAPAQYIQIAASQVAENMHQQQQQPTTAPAKNVHVSTTPNAMQPQQRSTTSAHITITAAQLQQILNASHKTNNNNAITTTTTRPIQQIDNNNQSSDQTTTVDIKQQPV